MQYQTKLKQQKAEETEAAEKEIAATGMVRMWVGLGSGLAVFFFLQIVVTMFDHKQP